MIVGKFDWAFGHARAQKEGLEVYRLKCSIKIITDLIEMSVISLHGEVKKKKI